MKPYYLLISFIAYSPIFSQIGINTSLPSKQSVIHIKGDGSKGMIIPQSNSPETLIPADSLGKAESGMIIYDSAKAELKFFNNKQKSWMPVYNVPIGGIIMWSGDPYDLPIGWALCNGQSYYYDSHGNTRATPDLRGKFIVGYANGQNCTADPNYPSDFVICAPLDPLHIHRNDDAGNSEYNQIGKMGGSSNVSLSSAAQLPNHNHLIQWLNLQPLKLNEDATGTLYYLITSVTSYTKTTTSTGTGATQENRPPYYVLAYIIRIK
jgi:microcystin-dependent protein